MSWWTKYEDIPYADHGRSMSGCDCWGLVCLVFREELGIELPGYLEDYDTSSEVPPTIRVGRDEDWRPVKVNDLEPFDIITFTVMGNFHVGLVGDRRRNKMLHILEGANVCQVEYKSINWLHRIEEGLRHASRV